MPSPQSSRLREGLARALARPLPGASAHRIAWPAHLPRHSEPEGLEGYGPAGVLLALCPGEAGVRIPLVRRPPDMRRHPGQISLPGGRVEDGEETVACALREAYEEIGLSPASVEVLGLLTPVPVSVSRTRIHPVVGWVRRPPRFRAQQSEVVEILTADPDALAGEGPRGRVRRERAGSPLEAPAYVVPSPSGEEALVWGATAIILAEFLEVWKEARAERTT